MVVVVVIVFSLAIIRGVLKQVYDILFNSFFRPFGAFLIFIALSPGADAPGYAFFRPFGPNAEKHP